MENKLFIVPAAVVAAIILGILIVVLMQNVEMHDPCLAFSAGDHTFVGCMLKR